MRHRFIHRYNGKTYRGFMAYSAACLELGGALVFTMKEGETRAEAWLVDSHRGIVALERYLTDLHNPKHEMLAGYPILMPHTYQLFIIPPSAIKNPAT